MVKLIVLFRKPPEAEVESFENVFSQVYVPAINAIPNLKKASVSRAIGAPRGEPPYHMIHEVYFENYESLVVGLNSAQGRAAGQHLMGFARDLVSMMYAEAWEE